MSEGLVANSRYANSFLLKENNFFVFVWEAMHSLVTTRVPNYHPLINLGGDILMPWLTAPHSYITSDKLVDPA